MIFPNHALIGSAAKIPTSPPTPVLSFSPVVIRCPNRRVDLQLRVSVPSTGDALPIILLSHGHGRSNWLSSHEGYGPLADFWAGHGFAVLQPTHLSSKTLDIALDGQNIRELFLDSRANDMTIILDNLDVIENTVPLLKGRLDRAKVAVAGHSLGGITSSILLGATNIDPRNGFKTDLFEKRITAGIVIGGTGNGGSDLSESGTKMLPFYDMDFTTMKTPALVVWGDEDVGPHLTNRGADWHADPYGLSPAPKDSLSIKGGKHGFGGISGWDAGETLDESPERLAVVQRMTLAYLKSQFYEGDESWGEASKVLKGFEELGSAESK